MTLVLFDCDGVILDSNEIKTEAFHQVGSYYGKEAAKTLVAYHTSHGGVSRYQKLKYFFETILKREEFEEEYQQGLSLYAKIVQEKLKNCKEIPGVRDYLTFLKNQSRNILLYVVSGSDQEELRKILDQRGFNHFFSEILGSPRPKRELVGEILKKFGGNGRQSVYFGDSANDYETALYYKIPFVMVYGKTEWTNWRQALDPQVPNIRDFKEIPLDILPL